MRTLMYLIGYSVLLISTLVHSQSLTVPLPAGCVPTIVGSAVECSGTPPPVTPPPPNQVVCAGYSATLVIPMQWGADNIYYSTGFNATSAVVAYFDTPTVYPVPAPTSGKGNITVINFSGPLVPRGGSLSAQPCDFTGGIGGTNVFNNQGPVASFTFGYSKPAGQGVPNLIPATRYYLNMYNSAGCPAGVSCDVRITFAKPAGT